MPNFGIENVSGIPGLHSLIATSLTVTNTRMPYGITYCYLPPGCGDIPAFTSTNLMLDLVIL